MKNITSNIVFILIAIILVLGLGFSSYNLHKNSPENKTSTVSGNATSTEKNTASKQNSYTIADVAKHNNQSSCWSVVNGNVYDLTGFISKHRGGEEAILSMCGTDGSNAFNDQHSGSARPAKELQTLFIGTLK